MPTADDCGASLEPPTEVGPDPDDPSRTVTFPDGALDGGCYVAGPMGRHQTSLLQSWCVQWAEAGHGFWYVHPRGPEPRELLARLPADRLDDVVWIDFDRTTLSEHLEVPAIQRVSVYPFDSPRAHLPDRGPDPVTLRVNAYLDAFEARPDDYDGEVATILAAVLPPLLTDTEYRHTDVCTALRGVTLEESLEPLADLLPGDGALRAQLRRVHEKDPRAFRRAAHLIGAPLDPAPHNPLVGETSYDIVDAVRESQIVLVTGDLPPAAERGEHTIHARVGTQLLVAALGCRLWEAGLTAPGSTPTFPVVLDGVADLTTGGAYLVQKLLEDADDTPLAPVLSGPKSKTLEPEVHITFRNNLDTTVLVTDQPTQDHEAMLATGSLETVKRYLDRNRSDGIADRSLAWLRTGTPGYLVGTGDVPQETAPAVIDDPPTSTHAPSTVADAIAASVERYGQEPQWMTPAMREEARVD